MKKTPPYPAKSINFILIALAALIRLQYIIFTDIGTRQHDLGYATSLGDGLVNPGHLGYIEYFVKFKKLPDFDPFSVFSYYHPPVHHIISAFFVKAAHSLGLPEPDIYEAAQIPTFIYGVITVIIAYKILKLLSSDEKKITLPLMLIAFHPGFIYMAGSIGNDMMAAMILFLISYLCLSWIMSGYNRSYLLLMAFFMGLGLIVKMNVIVIACPVAAVMLLRLIDTIKTESCLQCIKEYLLFACISLPIGLSWSIRNFVVFNVTPGISSATPDSIQYMGGYSLWQRFGIFESSSLSFPFHSESAEFCHNVWQILFKISLFTEIWPAGISAPLLTLCRIIYILAVIAYLVCTFLSIVLPIIRIRRGDTAVGVFLLTGFLAVIITYILFVIKYPYTCSCDFRYISVSLLFFAISLLPLKFQTSASSQ